MGHHLYETLGFRDEQTVERWRREPGGALPEESALAFTPDPELDRQAFGPTARAAGLPAPVRDRGGGGRRLAMGRPGNAAAYFGPCVSRRPEVARVLLNGSWPATATSRSSGTSSLPTARRRGWPRSSGSRNSVCWCGWRAAPRHDAAN